MCMFLCVRFSLLCLPSSWCTGCLPCLPLPHSPPFPRPFPLRAPADEAAAEICANGLASCVSVRHRDVEGQGFPCGGVGGGRGGAGAADERCSGEGQSSNGRGMLGADCAQEEAEGSGKADQQSGDGAAAQARGQGQGAQEEGNGVEGELNLAGVADAVFLDLPTPPKVRPAGLFLDLPTPPRVRPAGLCLSREAVQEWPRAGRQACAAGAGRLCAQHAPALHLQVAKGIPHAPMAVHALLRALCSSWGQPLSQHWALE